MSSLDIFYTFLFDILNILSFETPVARGYDNEAFLSHKKIGSFQATFLKQ